MRCEDALLLISGHLDQVNTAQEEQQLQEHLEQCADCRRVLEQFMTVDAGLLELEAALPEGLSERIMESVRKKASPVRKNRKWIAMGAMAAAVALVMGIGYYTFPGGQTTESAVDYDTAFLVGESVAEETFVYTTKTAAEPQAAPQDAPDAAAAPEEQSSVDPVSLAMELQAPVVVLDKVVEELEGRPSEVLSDGSLLYTLDSSDEAAQLGRRYAVMVYDPGAEAEVSFAVVK